MLPSNTVLLAAPCLALAAALTGCTDTPFVEASENGPTITLDDATPQASYVVRACLEGYFVEDVENAEMLVVAEPSGDPGQLRLEVTVVSNGTKEDRIGLLDGRAEVDFVATKGLGLESLCTIGYTVVVERMGEGTMDVSWGTYIKMNGETDAVQDARIVFEFEPAPEPM